MVTTLNKKSFKLPRLEKEKFVSLMRKGVEYNNIQGTFSIKSYDNIEKVVDALSEILKSPVIFLQSCSVCGKDFACIDCKYIESCETKNLPFTCVCASCLKAASPPKERVVGQTKLF
jgi:hypothetical protein